VLVVRLVVTAALPAPPPPQRMPGAPLLGPNAPRLGDPRMPGALALAAMTPSMSAAYPSSKVSPSSNKPWCRMRLVRLVLARIAAPVALARFLCENAKFGL
tara:strand:- start:33 stop:335 length:303 start_codon:yes stop_codon:yes gene_type:complete